MQQGITVKAAAFNMKHCSKNRRGMLPAVNITRQTVAAVQPQHRSSSHSMAVNTDYRSVQDIKAPSALRQLARAWR